MEARKVLLVEDDKEIAELVALNLKCLGFKTSHLEDGPSGLSDALTNDYFLVILDVMLPGLDGLEICREVRSRKPGIPIMILSARCEVTDRIIGLECGADDYLAKPFHIGELISRVRAIARRSKAYEAQGVASTANTAMKFGSLKVDREKRRVSISDKNVDLTAREYDLLLHMLKSPGRPFTRQQLLDAVWGYSFEGYEHTVNTHINRLRNKIEEDSENPRIILTVRGVGYRAAEVSEVE